MPCVVCVVWCVQLPLPFTSLYADANNPRNSYLLQQFVNGTKCGVTGVNRTTDVKVYCLEAVHDDVTGKVSQHALEKVEEVSTCHYEAVFRTTAVCDHPAFHATKLPDVRVECTFDNPAEQAAHENRRSSVEAKQQAAQDRLLAKLSLPAAVTGHGEGSDDDPTTQAASQAQQASRASTTKPAGKQPPQAPQQGQPRSTKSRRIPHSQRRTKSKFKPKPSPTPKPKKLRRRAMSPKHGRVPTDAPAPPTSRRRLATDVAAAQARRLAKGEEHARRRREKEEEDDEEQAFLDGDDDEAGATPSDIVGVEEEGEQEQVGSAAQQGDNQRSDTRTPPVAAPALSEEDLARMRARNQRFEQRQDVDAMRQRHVQEAQEQRKLRDRNTHGARGGEEEE